VEWYKERGHLYIEYEWLILQISNFEFPWFWEINIKVGYIHIVSTNFLCLPAQNYLANSRHTPTVNRCMFLPIMENRSSWRVNSMTTLSESFKREFVAPILSPCLKSCTVLLLRVPHTRIVSSNGQNSQKEPSYPERSNRRRLRFKEGS